VPTWQREGQTLPKLGLWRRYLLSFPIGYFIGTYLAFPLVIS
jgi:hypothetical protein